MTSLTDLREVVDVVIGVDTHVHTHSAAILDTAMSLAALTTLDARHDFTTLDLKLNFLRPVQADIEVRAEGRLVHGGRRIALCEGRLVDGAGKLLVHGTSSCLVVPRGHEPKAAKA